MASFQRLGRTEASELIGGNRTRIVREYSFMETPDNVYFEYRDPPPYDTPGRITDIAQSIANRIAGVLDIDGVTGLAYSQDIGSSGQLVDIWTVYWQTPGGKSTGEVDDIKQANLTVGLVSPLVAAAIANAESFE